MKKKLMSQVAVAKIYTAACAFRLAMANPMAALASGANGSQAATDGGGTQAGTAGDLKGKLENGFNTIYGTLCTLSIIVAGVAIAVNLLIGMFGGEKTIEKSKAAVKYIIISVVVLNAVGLILQFIFTTFGISQGDASSLHL